jgi:hypothetical protein
MTTTIITCEERPAMLEQADKLTRDVWPEYNNHGDVLNQYWARLYEEFPAFQFVLFDNESDSIIGKGHSIPCSWDGATADLPEGIDAVIQQGFALHQDGGTANALSALAIALPPENQGKGWSRVLVESMREIASSFRLANLIAPVRPNWKHRYPLIPIERYALWTHSDGFPFDPWMRVHARIGGEILRTAPRSLKISGTVSEWEQWTGMVFPESGTYVIPDGLAPVAVDRETDLGLYWEPNVWMRHSAPTK